MPRLLSNKSPKKTLSAKVEKFEEQKQTNTKKKSLRPEENMSAWEYYNHLMRYGKRKMTRSEWVVWSLKKDQEDLKKGKCIRLPPFNRVVSSVEYNWRLKKDPHFVDTVAREEFSLDFKREK